MFDSGIGGLTVQEAILSLDVFHNDNYSSGPDGRKDFEHERFLYFGDQANMPYGNYPSAGRQDFLKELILKDAAFLLGRRYWPKAYPNAIGRTTGLAGKRFPEVVQQGSVGLAGAIEGDPAFISSNDSENAASQAYLGPSAANKAAALDMGALEIYGFDPAGMLGDQQVPESLRLNSVANYVRYDVATLVRNHKASGRTTAIDTVVLGCTHFPLVKQEILNAFAVLRACEHHGERPFESLIAESITVVNPAEMTAKELFREMARRKLFRVPVTGEAAAKDRFFLSIANPGCAEAKRNADGSLDRDYKYGRQQGQLEIEDTICVPMEISLLPASSINLIRSRLPEVWARLNAADSLAP